MKKYFLQTSLFAFIWFCIGTRLRSHSRTQKQQQFQTALRRVCTPNSFRTSSGAPGVDYYQQQVDYKMDIELDDANTRLYGQETITYTNNSPDALPYLWVQLDQNIRNENDMEGAKNPSGAPKFRRVESFVEEFSGGEVCRWL